MLCSQSLLEDLQFDSFAEGQMPLKVSVLSLCWSFWINLQQHFLITCSLKDNRAFQREGFPKVLINVRLPREAERLQKPRFISLEAGEKASAKFTELPVMSSAALPTYACTAASVTRGRRDWEIHPAEK